MNTSSDLLNYLHCIIRLERPTVRQGLVRVESMKILCPLDGVTESGKGEERVMFSVMGRCEVMSCQ